MATSAVREVARSETELIQLCIARDERAIRHVTIANNQRLFRAAWSILKNRSEAEEAVQTAYLKAFTRMGKFAGRSSLSTWLTRIVINEALGRLRTARRRRAGFDTTSVLIMDEYRDKLMRGSAPSSPDCAVAREQLRILLEKAIADLPDAFRTVFVLREVEALTVEETAEALGSRPEHGQDPAAPGSAQAPAIARARSPVRARRHFPLRRGGLRRNDRAGHCRTLRPLETKLAQEVRARAGNLQWRAGIQQT